MKFSIITVSYNSGKTIERTMKSVLTQSCQDYEYIIVDGASNDDTMRIVKSYEDKYGGRMHYISEPRNGGTGTGGPVPSVLGFIEHPDFIIQKMTNIQKEALLYDTKHILSKSFLEKMGMLR